jgi:hypothetical protein
MLTYAHVCNADVCDSESSHEFRAQQQLSCILDCDEEMLTYATRGAATSLERSSCCLVVWNVMRSFVKGSYEAVFGLDSIGARYADVC